ncbi:uncharacterized protein LY89DRAFT_748562 [Mollisia scopiformis]|uniref:Gfd2/YDR514C-like C-terminal domain-containing protein n=1 Tax=Mollisia scopiformis TaxID=149040 RepID=A0A194XBU9_MOLSC|nr:uncharacterized protein LY89DRAFT_748562 [Mollisia scopiformis]KUJ17232.1 hypothetical protein LY89DRAFT_748562 [Mollisia scopiformis]
MPPRTVQFLLVLFITIIVKAHKNLMYHWGTAEKIPITSMLSKINTCLRIYQNRSIILVGHGVSNDLAALKSLGFDFQKNRVIAKLDTYLLAQDLQMGDFTLKNRLMELKCPCNFKFHNASNDTNFALRALLLLGIKAIGAAESNETSERVKILWWIAMEEVLSPKKKKFTQFKLPEAQESESNRSNQLTPKYYRQDDKTKICRDGRGGKRLYHIHRPGIVLDSRVYHVQDDIVPSYPPKDLRRGTDESIMKEQLYYFKKARS